MMIAQIFLFFVSFRVVSVQHIILQDCDIFLEWKNLQIDSVRAPKSNCGRGCLKQAYAIPKCYVELH